MFKNKQIHFQCLKFKVFLFAGLTVLSLNISAATFDNHVENGTFDQPNNTSNTFINNLTVDGNWNLNSIGNITDMFFSGPQFVTGAGFINLSDRTTNRIFSSANNLLTIGSNLTIQGAGQLGLGQTTFNNMGSVFAQGTNTFTISSNNFSNNGELRAEGDGGLVITSTNLTNNTAVDVNPGSNLQLISSNVNGVFNNLGGGTLSATATTFDNSTINGVMTQANNTTNTFTNNLTVNGSWLLNSVGNITDMFFSGAQNLNGPGEIVLSDRIQNRIYSTGNNLLTIGADMTIRGAGQLGVGQTTFDNQGGIRAQGANTLTILSSDFTNNGELRAEGDGGLVITSTNLTNNTAVDVNPGSNLQLISSNVNGVFNNLGGGTLSATATTFDNSTINGVMTQANNTTNTFTNNLTVNGSWLLNSVGNITDMFFSGAQNLNGPGEIVLSDRIQNRIYSTANNLLTIGADMTIRGAGQLGVGQTTFKNQGDIIAQGANTLSIYSSSFTNNGTLRASGSGGLLITSTNLFNNTSVNVDNSSQLQLVSSSVNGTFNIDAGGTATATNTIFSDATINGALTQINNTSNTVQSDLTVNGQWLLNSAGNNTNMIFSGPQNIKGNGEIVLSDRVQNRIYTSSNDLLTINNGVTVRGAGQLGIGQTSFDNQGTILAQGNSTLSIHSSDFTNNGTLRAEGNGGLLITSSTVTNNSSIDINASSKLELTSSTVSGVFNITSGALATATNTTFDATTINGAMTQLNNTTNTIKNGITVNGSWNLNSIGNNTNLIFSGAQTISGNGEIVLSNRIQNRIYSNNTNITVGNDMTIRGAGQIGIAQSSLTNNGTINADQSNSLSIATNGTGFNNTGNLNASGNGGINITGGFTNSGNIEITANSTINRTGSFIQTTGQTNVDGTLISSGLVDIQGGLLSGNGLINANVSNAGTVSVGNSAGLLSIQGDYTQLLSGVFNVELAGITPETEYDVLDVSGDAFLDGILNFSLIDGYVPIVGSSFDILSSENIFGSFGTLNLTLGSGIDWQIEYLQDVIGSTDVVRLTALATSAVPLPASAWLFASGLIGLVGVARGKRLSRQYK